jgi:large subunit ribosomal protein L19
MIMAISIKYNDIVLHSGDTIRVHYKIIEKETVSGKAKKEKKEEVRERIQIFEGIIIAIRGHDAVNRMITVRRIGAGSIGVERIFPVASPWIKNIEVKKMADVRRSKLYYLRDKKGKEQERLKERKVKKAVNPIPQKKEAVKKDNNEPPKKHTHG